MIFGENKRVCCFCGREFMGMGNNPAPVMTEKTKRCCNDCNTDIVIPRRFFDYIKARQEKTEVSN